MKIAKGVILTTAFLGLKFQCHKNANENWLTPGSKQEEHSGKIRPNIGTYLLSEPLQAMKRMEGTHEPAFL